MKKGIRTKKLSRTTNERKQLFRNLIRDTVKNGSITTTLAKAKVVQPQLEKLITAGKAGTLQSMRKLIAETGDSETAAKLTEMSKLFIKRPGGYTRIIKLGNRSGDNSEMVKFEWVEKLEKIEVIAPVKVSAAKTKLPEIEKTVVPKSQKPKTKTKQPKTTIKTKAKNS